MVENNNTMSCLKIIIFILLFNLMLSCFNCHSICSCNKKIHSIETFDVADLPVDVPNTKTS